MADLSPMIMNRIEVKLCRSVHDVLDIFLHSLNYSEWAFLFGALCMLYDNHETKTKLQVIIVIVSILQLHVP